jgi:hypothetical protein
MLGKTVDGVVTGGFDAGYFLSCDINGVKCRGMLFSPVLTVQKTAPNGGGCTSRIHLTHSLNAPGFFHYTFKVRIWFQSLLSNSTCTAAQRHAHPGSPELLLPGGYELRGGGWTR